MQFLKDLAYLRPLSLFLFRGFRAWKNRICVLLAVKTYNARVASIVSKLRGRIYALLDGRSGYPPAHCLALRGNDVEATRSDTRFGDTTCSASSPLFPWQTVKRKSTALAAYSAARH